jgi:anti-sigma B factor antagonist
MTEATLSLGVRRVEESACILDIEGDITAFSEEALMDAYSEGAGDGVKAVILNFTGLEYMNSGGIGLLVTVLVRANRAKQKLLAFGLTEHYREIFELTRLDEAIGIYATEADALAAAA